MVKSWLNIYPTKHVEADTLGNKLFIQKVYFLNSILLADSRQILFIRTWMQLTAIKAINVNINCSNEINLFEIMY